MQGIRSGASGRMLHRALVVASEKRYGLPYNHATRSG